MKPSVSKRAPVPALVDSAALVVGGTSGVGLATAHRLLHLGVRRLAIAGRNHARIEAARSQLISAFPAAEIIAWRADAADPDATERMVEDTASQFGSLDLVVCSTVPADVTPELLFKTSTHDLASILSGIAAPPLHVIRASLPRMRAQRSGSIVTIASDAAKVATPGESVIGAAMAAIVMFTRTAALECKRDGIRINVVTPSLIGGTPTGQRMLEGGFSAKIFQRATELAELGVPSADDVSKLVCHLIGPDSAHVTGQAVSINGGISTA